MLEIEVVQIFSLSEQLPLQKPCLRRGRRLLLLGFGGLLEGDPFTSFRAFLQFFIIFFDALNQTNRYRSELVDERFVLVHFAEQVEEEHALPVQPLTFYFRGVFPDDLESSAALLSSVRPLFEMFLSPLLKLPVHCFKN